MLSFGKSSEHFWPGLSDFSVVFKIGKLYPLEDDLEVAFVSFVKNRILMAMPVITSP